ncbi:MAG TPA: CpsB/CapC family capsule biosynthesis tyrosine phosphatase [Solirubrobacteraceae bacterium]|jgi:protein-tyrosine phosphatase
MIDLHTHVLPGIDDGPQTIEDSVELARAAVAAGARTLVATPHVSWTYPNEPDTIAALVEELGEHLDAAGIPLEIRVGAELAMTRLVDMSTEELLRLRLGGGNWLLLEPPFSSTVTGLGALVLELQRQGHEILLAHPERCPAFHRNPEMLRELVNAGVLTSVTAGSLVGRFGGEVRRFALRMARERLIHNVTSDAHDTIRRPPGVVTELRQAGLEPLEEWLTEEVPTAILGGGEIPPRPEIELSGIEPVRRTWWRRRP